MADRKLNQLTESADFSHVYAESGENQYKVTKSTLGQKLAKEVHSDFGDVSSGIDYVCGYMSDGAPVRISKSDLASVVAERIKNNSTALANVNFGYNSLSSLVKDELPTGGCFSTYVDLGLPSGRLWAKMNVGATSETDFGDFFAWGATSPYRKGIDSTDNYFGGSTASTIQSNLAPNQDAATVNWGKAWRLPTYAEEVELKDNCDWEWQTNFEGSGHNGYKVMKKDDHDVYIFLPAAGYLNGLSHNNVGTHGNYWSSSFDSSSYCWILYFTSSGRLMNYRWRGYGFSVRPVRA